MGELFILENLANNYVQFGLILFILFLFLGEPLIIAAAFFLSSHNYDNWLLLGGLAFISAIIAEFFWFYMGRIPSIKSFFLTKGALTIESFIKKIHLHKPLPLLFFTRLFTGLTIIAIVYLSSQKIPIKKFAFCSIVVNAFWTPIVVAIGYMAGLGYTYALNILNDIHLVSAVFLVCILIFYLAYRVASRLWIKKIVTD